MSSKTIEGKAKTKNGVKRLLFCGLAILLEVGFFLYVVLLVNEDFVFLKTLDTLLALALVLYICNQNKTSSLKMPWIILILATPVLGISLFFLMGSNKGTTKKMRARYKAIDDVLFPPLPQENPLLKTLEAQQNKGAGVAKYLYHKCRFPLYQNTKVTYFKSASEGLEAQLEAISKATEFVFLEYHAIEYAESWIRILDVLEDRVLHGVTVRVYYDDMGSIGFVDTDFIQKMKDKGINCRVFNPFVPGLNLFLNNRDHRKITVVDGKVGFTGGYNLANEYFNITHPYGEWKDSGIQLEGEAVNTLTRLFLEMWNASKGDAGKDKDYGRYLKQEAQVAEAGSYVLPYADSPLDEERVGENVYISLIEKAEKYCYFMTPYLIITDEMTHALTLAAARGVDVRIITPGRPDKKIVYSVTRSFYQALVNGGVRIYEWTPGFCHAKMCIVDGELATCGTINLDYRSLYHHFENGCLLIGSQAIQDIKEDFDATFQESREVTEQYRSTRMRLGQLILRIYAALL